MKRQNNKTALICAVDLLALRPHSTKELYTKLKRRGYDDEEISEAIARLEARHYLDDTDLCQRQCQMYLAEERRSIRAIKYKLVEKGFSASDIEDAFAQNNLDFGEYECAVCLRHLHSHFRPSTADRAKCQAYLYRKGFASSNIRQAVELYFAEIGDEN